MALRLGSKRHPLGGLRLGSDIWAPLGTPTLAIESVGAVRSSANFVIDGLGFGAAQGAGSVTLDGVVCTVIAWADSQITARAPSTLMFTGTKTLRVTTNESLLTQLAGVTYLPPAGFVFERITEVPVPAGSLASGVVGLAVGDEVYVNATTTRQGGAQTGTVAFNGLGDGTITISGITVDGDYPIVGIQVRDASDGTDTSNGPKTITFDTTAPQGYAVNVVQASTSDVTGNIIDAVITGAEVGATYSYTISSSAGGTPITGIGSIATTTQNISGLNASSLPDGTLTFSIALTDPFGHVGTAATDTAIKTTDRIADAFVFTPRTNVAAGSDIGSNAITVSGLTPGYNAPTTVAGGKWRKNGVAWLTTAGTVQNDDVVETQVRSALTHSTPAVTTLSINGVQASFTVTTAAPDVIAPQLIGSAIVDNIVEDGFRVRFTPNESVTLRVAVFPDAAEVPVVGAVIAGSGAPYWLSPLESNVGNVEQTIIVSGIAGGPFSTYIALLDGAGNPLLVTIAGIELLDSGEPPELIGAPVVHAGETALIVNFAATQDGQWRLLALPQSADDPDFDEVFAGTGAGGETPLRDTGLHPLYAETNTPAVLAALSPATNYRLALGMRDGSGNAQVYVFDGSTLPLAVVPNVTLQVVRIDANTARLTAAANVAIASLQFQLNGARIGPAFVAPPFLFDWNMSALDSNVYQVTALANLGGNQTVQSLPATFFVAQPELSIGEVFFDEDYGIPQATASQAFADLVGGFGIPTSEPAMRAEWEKEVTRAGVTINNDSDYSPFWRLLSAIVTKPALWLVHLLINGLLPNYFVKYARGAFLDILAWGVNLERKLASEAVGVIRFSRSDASQALIIPAGTIIETVPINERVYRLRTTEAVTLAEGVAFIDAPVEAEESGSQHNLAAGYYSILPQPIAGVIATNVSGWITKPGADTERDDDLRLRIKNQFGTVSGHHVDAVYKAIISENQGISIDRIYIEHDAPRGPGTANAYILFDVGDNPTPYINALNQHIIDNAEHGLGDDFLVLPMPETQHDLTVTGYALDSLSTAQKAELRDGVEAFIRAAFRETDSYDNVTKVLPQGRFSFSRLGEELHREFPGLASVRFDLVDIVSAIEVPRLDVLQVTVA